MIKNLKRHGIIVFAVGLFLLIVGLWFIVDPYPAVKLPDEDPIVYLSIKEKDMENEIEVLEDGTVFQVLKQDRNAGSIETRIWKKGFLSEIERAILTDYLDSHELRDLDARYEYPLPALKGSPTATVECSLCVRCGEDRKIAIAVHAEPGETDYLHPEAPYPLNELYLLLLEFGDTTLEIFREEIAE